MAEAVEVSDEEVWELVVVAIDTLAFYERKDGVPFKLPRSERESLALRVCERNYDRLPLRIRSRLRIKEKRSDRHGT